MQEVFGRDSVFDESLRAERLSFDFGKREFHFYSRAMNLAFVTEMPPAVIRLQISDVFFTFHVFGADDAASMKSFQSSQSTATGVVSYGDIMINDLLDGIVGEVVIAIEDEEQFALGEVDASVDSTVFSAIGLAMVCDAERAILGYTYDGFIFLRDFCHEAPDDIGCVVGATIVHYDPLKCIRCLTAQAFVASREQMRPVVGWGEDSDEEVGHFRICFYLVDKRYFSGSELHLRVRICKQVLLFC